MANIRVRVVPKSAMEGDLAGGRLLENLMERADELTDSINAFAAKITDRIGAGIPENPAGWGMSEATVTFGIDLEAEAGVIVSRATAGASFAIEITWSRTT